jgi:hypothetical protein
MGCGKPVIFTESEEVSRYPNDTCVRIQSGVREAEHLASVLVWLQRFRSDARWIGTRAQQYIRAHHGAEEVLTRYAQALC